ncbi:lipopolysaccharide biosynthesis protein [Longimycelium tulufanense]|uniref:lipopolysaccharide biosynthesis protein n=1 Tax=Longimycelium tulufanense TaxID=907463 RepID=UPI001E289D7C|nr:hypothetical protein [Longimycelium tulufanense]
MSGTEMPAVGRSVGTVGIALLVAVGLGYVVLIAVGRLLSPADYAIFMTFWGVVFGVGATLAPLEQETSRQAALAAVHGQRAGATVLRTVAVGAAAAAVFGLLILVPAMNERLFSGYGALAVVAGVAGVAFAPQYGVRGLLMGQHRVRFYGGLIVAEAGLRLVLLGAVVLAVVTGLVPVVGVVPAAITVAVGSFAWLLFVRPATTAVDRHIPGERWSGVTQRVVVLMASAGLTATVITGYPAMVRLLAGGDLTPLGALFAALMILRFPLLLMSPLQAMAVPLVVRLSHSDDGRHRLRVLLAQGIVGSILIAAVGAVLGALVGPWGVRFLLGPRYHVDAWAAGGLLASSVLLTAIQLLCAVLIARTQVHRVLLTWAVIAATSAVVLVAWPATPLVRAVLGLVLAPALGLGVAVACVLRHDAGPSRLPHGSDEAPEGGR